MNFNLRKDRNLTLFDSSGIADNIEDFCQVCISLLESLLICFEYCSVCARVLLVSGLFVTK